VITSKQAIIVKSSKIHHTTIGLKMIVWSIEKYQNMFSNFE